MQRTWSLGLATVLLGAFVLVTPACTGNGAGVSDEAYRESILTWRQGRLDRLTSPTGYLALAGLLWLDEGEYTVGSGPDDDLVVRAEVAPPRACVLQHHAGKTTLIVSPGVDVFIGDEKVQKRVLRTDAEEDTDIVKLGDVSFYAIQRADHYGIRMRDPESPIRRNFGSIDSWPIDRAYAVDARFEPYTPPHKIPIVNELGFIDSTWTTGSVHFTLNGKECSLDALVDTLEDDYLFLIFRDHTSGVETYGAGRFLYTDAPKDGHVLVDFNKAYNPPCAFSPYTTCPVPPLQNELDVTIHAGEKMYQDKSGHGKEHAGH